MSNYKIYAQALTDLLRLESPPIGICLTDTLPKELDSYQGKAQPAGCVFWQKAQTEPIVTTAKDHQYCAVGMHTHRLPKTASQETDLHDTLNVFAQLEYLHPDDVPNVPVLEKTPNFVIYTPLSMAPVTPDVVLFFVKPAQTLILTEAAQVIDSTLTPAMGRPACALIPQVNNTSRAALSLGCCGARAYMDTFAPDIQIFAIPGRRLAEYVKQIEIFSKANHTLDLYHQCRKEQIDSGKTPTVKESLTAMEKTN